MQEKERLYLELKSILARQPGPEAAEQLSLYQARLGYPGGQGRGAAQGRAVGWVQRSAAASCLPPPQPLPRHPCGTAEKSLFKSLIWNVLY